MKANILKATELGSIFVALGFFLLVFGPLAGTIRLWDLSGITLSPSGTVSCIYGVTLLGFGLFITKGKPSVSKEGILICFVFLLACDWMTRDYSFLPGPAIRGEIIFGALGWMLMSYTPFNRISAFWWLCIAGGILIWGFLDAAQGRFIYSDDHSVVLYRLSLLKENFPFIPFYNPLWNAGLDARDFFATGILNLFILGSPLIYLFPVPDIYNLLICGVLFILLPLCTYAAARIDEQSEFTSAVAGILSVANSLLWYRWGLKYGSMGFVTATSLLPLNFVIAKRLIFNESLPTTKVLFLFCVTFTLMLFWSLSGIVFIPLIIAALLRARSLLREKRIRSVLTVILALNLPWILLFLSVSKVSNFISVKGKGTHQNDTQEIGVEGTSNQKEFSSSVVKGNERTIKATTLLKTAREIAIQTDIVHLLFFIPGILYVRNRYSRYVFIATGIWLITLGFLIAPYKPQLELDRMLIILNVIASIPCAVFINEVVSCGLSKRWLHAAITSLIIGTLFASVLSVSNTIYNRTLEKYFHVDDVFFSLGKALKENVGSGRGVFLGFVLHELDFGHLAPLMQETQKPLVASSLYHNVWKYTNLIPKEYMVQGESGIERYLNLMNASVVVAHEKDWRDYCDERNDIYTLISQHGVFSVYKRKTFENSYFLEGQGEVINQDSHSVTLTVKSPSSVVKFNYFPFLSSNNCTIHPIEFPGGIQFIRLEGCDTNKVVTIQSKNALQRVFQG